MKKFALFIILLSVLNCTKKEEKDNTSTIALLALASAQDPILGNWRQTSMSINGTQATLTGTFVDTYTSDKITSALNGGVTAGGTTLNYNCSMTYSYTKTTSLITATVTTTSCAGTTSGTTVVQNYSISGRILTTTGNTSGNTIISTFTKE
jgi:hypothetical protein